MSGQVNGFVKEELIAKERLALSKRASIILLAVFISGCVGPLVEVVGVDEKTTEKLRSQVQVYAPEQLKEIKYKVLRPIQATSCMNKIWDPAPSEDNAIDQLRFKSARIGGNGISNLMCESPEGTNVTKNCWQSITCYASAIQSIQSEVVGVTHHASDVDVIHTISTSKQHAHAVVIGIEEYQQKLPKADYAVHDAEIMGQYLTKALGYQEENVVVLLNERATKTSMEKYVEGWLFDRVEKDDSVFIYYSGHGAPNSKTGKAYLVPYDGDPAFVAQTGYSLERLYDRLAALPAKEVVVMLDSCFSGAGGRSVIAKGMRPMVLSVENPLLTKGRTMVLTASAGDQVSSTYEQKSHGLLTYFFLKGLQGEADQNNDKRIELRELFEYLKPQVERTARREFHNEQTPQLLGSPDTLSKGVVLIESNK